MDIFIINIPTVHKNVMSINDNVRSNIFNINSSPLINTFTARELPAFMTTSQAYSSAIRRVIRIKGINTKQHNFLGDIDLLELNKIDNKTLQELEIKKEEYIKGV